ncbi:MAG TPA: sigma-70 family RNA polymerase sigma factor [Vicinamibacteria bacterium]|jgi:RNA polymerase sigma-70 factor (ECF subfamily)|nr:sigma-70 family RNA polymerase sigma factor [Vicinamibacteria bacterium]
MFPTTRWTLILASNRGGESERMALEQLCATYWKPVYFFLRRKGLSPAAAEDAVQGFFLHLLQRDFLPRLDPAKGRFRSYLLRSLEHYLVNLHEHDSALKRGGGLRFVPLDVALAEEELPAAPTPPGDAFEREWAMGLMERALARLAREYEQGRRKGRAEVVLRFFGLDRAPTYAEAAAECGMTVPQFKAALHRARARFREILHEEVAATVDDDADREREIGDLLRALS